MQQLLTLYLCGDGAICKAEEDIFGLMCVAEHVCVCVCVCVSTRACLWSVQKKNKAHWRSVGGGQ